jgi:cyclohexanecarboxylate-CoA ligase
MTTEQSLWGLVEEAAQVRTEEVLLADDGGRSLTATQLQEEAERVAAGLHLSGLTGGQVVAWQLPTTLEAVVLMAGLARIGAVQIPIIPAFGQREIRFIMEQAEADLLIVPETWRGSAIGELVQSLPLKVLTIDLERGALPGIRLPHAESSSPPQPPHHGSGCRWIYYTSGTTAEPKGARHTDASVIASSNGVVDSLGLRTGDIYPIAWPIAHIGGIAMLSAVLRAGGILVLFDRFDPATTPIRMAAHRPTILGSATPFFQAYVAAQRRHQGGTLYPALRACVGGGAATPVAVNLDVAETLGVPGVVGAWGLTEFPVATSETPTDPLVGSTVGRPVAGVEVRVLDGELCLRGPQCSLGYVDESLDSYAFDTDGWFRTGDLGSIDADGRVRVEGRSKDVIIRNAENISALEVEDVVFRHPSVDDVAVVGVPDVRSGERVCAVVVPAPGRTITLEELATHCKSSGLAPYKCPERLEFATMLPRNAMGKVLKRSLLQALGDQRAE